MCFWKHNYNQMSAVGCIDCKTQALPQKPLSYLSSHFCTSKWILWLCNNVDCGNIDSAAPVLLLLRLSFHLQCWEQSDEATLPFHHDCKHSDWRQGYRKCCLLNLQYANACWCFWRGPITELTCRDKHSCTHTQTEFGGQSTWCACFWTVGRTGVLARGELANSTQKGCPATRNQLSVRHCISMQPWLTTD